MASWTKRQFIELALGELGMFDITADRFRFALGRLDAMVAHWNARGIRIGWPMTLDPDDSSLDTETGAPDAAIEAIILGLAIRLAPGVGKVVQPDTRRNASDAMDALSLHFAITPNEIPFPQTMPVGEGNWPLQWADQQYYDEPIDPLRIGDEELTG